MSFLWQFLLQPAWSHGVSCTLVLPANKQEVIMKEATITQHRKKISLREVATALVVFLVVLAYPVYSVFAAGSFFHDDDNRTSEPLTAMAQRPADATDREPQLFQEPMISVTFDDGFDSIYTQAMPLLQKYGIQSTQYILAGKTDDPYYVSWKQIANMQKGGHEIACHTMTHTDLTSLTDADLNYQVTRCKTELTKRFGVISNFASPYGAANTRTLDVISKHFDSQRNTNGDPTNGVTEVDVNTAANFDRFNIIGVTVRHDTTVKQLEDLVNFAKQNNGWVVLTYHQADEGNASQFGVNPASLDKQFAYLSKTDVRIVTMQDALEATKLKDLEF
ncbi:MAG TPA: polysaccharide deacetylase family protein [Candidatus Saccharimonadales bacterium]